MTGMYLPDVDAIMRSIGLLLALDFMTRFADMIPSGLINHGGVGHARRALSALEDRSVNLD